MIDSDLPVVCPHCGTPVPAGHSRCWLCQTKLTGNDQPNPYASPRPLAGENAPWQFSLASLFLITTLVAVNLGLYLILPGLGVLMSLICLPALIRTVSVGNRSKQSGRQNSTLQKIETFLASFCIVIAAGLAALIASMTVCVTGGTLASLLQAPEPLLISIALGGGLIAAVAVTVFSFWLTRPRD